VVEIHNLLVDYVDEENKTLNVDDDIRDKVKELLPPTVGFFFGSYDVDCWYFRNIVSTVECLNRLVEFDSEYKCYYFSASW